MIHPTADVSREARIGAKTRVWHFAQIREGATVGDECVIGKDVYVDFDVAIGNRVKIQNGALIYHGVTIDDGVFIGPQACLTNDRHPRAVTSDGQLKKDSDWRVGKIHVRYGASIGAGAVILPDVAIGRFAMVAAGAVVTRSVTDHGLVLGVPARLVGYACHCGRRLGRIEDRWHCTSCDWSLRPEEQPP